MSGGGEERVDSSSPRDVALRLDGRWVGWVPSSVSRRRVAVLAGLVAVSVGAVAAAAPGDAVPHTFSAGGAISAAEMNANFSAVTGQIGELADGRLFVQSLPTTGFSVSWSSQATLDIARVTRRGANVEIWGRIAVTAAPPTDVTLVLSLPAGLTPAAHARSHRLAGDIDYRVMGSGTWTGSFEPSAGPDQLTFYTPGTSDNRVRPVSGGTIPAAWAAGDFITFRVVFPVEGWTPTGT